MAALLPLLEKISCLMQLAQFQNAFVCDFVAAMNQIQGLLYKLFLALDTLYRGNQFFLLSQLVNFKHKVIHMCSSQDLNKAEEVLVFSFGEHTFTSKHATVALNREGFKDILAEIKKSIASEPSAWTSTSDVFLETLLSSLIIDFSTYLNFKCLNSS